MSSEDTINFHKDLRRPNNKKIALELKEKCSRKYSDILANDFYASLKASYREDELKQIIKERKLNSLDVCDEGDQYLIVYGNV